MQAGIRVVRGPGWKWDDQDGGEGYVGTIIIPGHQRNAVVQNDTVFVQWDNGQLGNYRVGNTAETQDLLVLDNGPAGIVLGRFTCDECHKSDVGGFRWQCLECGSYDLCDSCYTSEQHNITHPFLRHDWPSKLDGVPVPARIDAVKMNSFGLFPNASVARGPDWRWGDQDGGAGNVGLLLEIISTGNSLRAVGQVAWSGQNKNTYRIGHEGKVDIVAVSPASGGSYYPQHLPVVDAEKFAKETSENISAAAGGSSETGSFAVGDRVRIELDAEIFQALQDGHGGYFEAMKKLIGRTGVVKSRTPTGDLYVKFAGTVRPLIINPAALSPATTTDAPFKRGDIIRVSTDMDRVKTLQVGHGEWNDHMTPILGAVGKVQSVDSDGDIKVKLNGHRWCLNVQCCTLLDQEELSILDRDSSSSSSEDSDGDGIAVGGQAGLEHLLRQLRDAHEGFSSLISGGDSSQLDALISGLNPAALTSLVASPENIVAAAAQNDVRVVRAILEKHPDKVDERNSSRTALQMASLRGHVNIVRILLDAGADMKAQDDDGDMPTHFAVFENRADVLNLLIERGADINLVNYKLLTPLHIAVHKQHLQCTRVLVKHGCNLNAKNPEGNTALNDAVRLMNGDLVMVLTAPNADFDYHSRNEDGFNALQFAALVGNNKATKVILARAPELIDKRKEDGFTPLHMATISGHKQVAETLITLGNASINAKNEKGHTPLMVAAQVAHTSLIELLVSKGADVNASDMTGNTCLHMVLGHWKAGFAVLPGTTDKVQPRKMDEAVEILKIKSELPETTRNRPWLAIACFLVFYGANLKKRNWTSQAPIDIVSDPHVEDVLRKIAKKGGELKLSTTNNTSLAAEEQAAECQMCSDVPASVIFLPCEHCVACKDCAERMKKCFICKTVIVSTRFKDPAFQKVKLHETKEQIYRRI